MIDKCSGCAWMVVPAEPLQAKKAKLNPEYVSILVKINLCLLIMEEIQCNRPPLGCWLVLWVMALYYGLSVGLCSW